MMNIKLITETDAMKKPGITSRQTMCNYQIKHGFPRPIRTHPKAYLENAVNQWILNGASTRRFLNVPEKLIEAVNACRAAMLAQPVSSCYKLVPIEVLVTASRMIDLCRTYTILQDTGSYKELTINECENTMEVIDGLAGSSTRQRKLTLTPPHLYCIHKQYFYGVHHVPKRPRLSNRLSR